MDMKPMALIHTTGTTLEGKSAYRHWAAFDKDKGRVARQTYELKQPDCHSKYRSRFSGVDRFNNIALGSNSSVQYAVHTERWQVRFFLAMLAISETNAYLAHNIRRTRKRVPEGGEIKRKQWKIRLAAALCTFHNKREARVMRSGGNQEPPVLKDVLTCMGATAQRNDNNQPV